LLRWAIISAVVTVVYIFEFERNTFFAFKDEILKFEKDQTDMALFLWLPLLFNIVTDYISLFFVRRWLGTEWKSPMIAMVTGAMVGIAIILLFFLVRVMISATLFVSSSFGISVADALTLFWLRPDTVVPHLIIPLLTPTPNEMNYPGFLHPALIIPAMAVHLWLPMFLLGVLLVQLVNSLVWSLDRMQWFLKQGREHPLLAAGYVIAALVFVVTAVAPWLFRGLRLLASRS
jgi:hypothetical protein